MHEARLSTIAENTAEARDVESDILAPNIVVSSARKYCAVERYARSTNDWTVHELTCTRHELRGRSENLCARIAYALEWRCQYRVV